MGNIRYVVLLVSKYHCHAITLIILDSTNEVILKLSIVPSNALYVFASASVPDIASTRYTSLVFYNQLH